MKPQYGNQIMSSALLWVDNLILAKGDAFTNRAINFYPISSPFSGIYTYSSPYSQFVYDSSILGASVPTGIYLDGSFLSTGVSGYLGTNYERGQVYFNTEIVGANRITGYFALKDLAVSLTEKDGAELLFETNLALRPRSNVVPTGLNDNQITYPIIMLKNSENKNTPFAFGGEDLSEDTIDIYVLADSAFLLDATTSILRDAYASYVPIFAPTQMPFNYLGGLKNGSFNYTGIAYGKAAAGSGAFISSISASKINSRVFSEVTQLNDSVYFGEVEMTLEIARNPRANGGTMN